MAKIVAILGSSGDGKTTSTIINPDGKFDLDNYQGMDPKQHIIINLDKTFGKSDTHKIFTSFKATVAN